MSIPRALLAVESSRDETSADVWATLLYGALLDGDPASFPLLPTHL